MKVFEKADEIASFVQSRQNEGRRIALVPTMGALHRGHLALIERASSIADDVVVSIYINPTQFAPGEDLSSYPRTIKEDLDKCRNLDVAAVFTPSDKQMYLSDHSTYVEETSLSCMLCGASRPSHFRGVTTIVMKLFNIVSPEVAVFGRKDAQQARIIIRMVRDLNIPVSIDLVSTVREDDGLAMSSRNAYLSPEERLSASRIYASLLKAEGLIRSGVRSCDEIKAEIRAVLSQAQPPIALEYAEIVSDPDMQLLSEARGDLIIALAARIGSTRLIDNIEISAD